MELSHAFLESDWPVVIVELSATFTAALVVLLGGVGLVWRATRSLAWRCAAVPVLALGAFAALDRMPVPTEQGTWICKSCGGAREELRYLDYTLFASPLRASSRTPRTGLARGECSHAWYPNGCHVHGRDVHGTTRVSCSWSVYP